MKARLLGLLAGTAVLTLSSTFAQAADLPSRRMAPMAPAPTFAPVPVFTWAGAYVGVNAGWGWNDDDNNGFFGGGTSNYAVPLIGGGVANYTLSNPNSFFGNDNNNDGFVGGAQAGYNFQAPGSPWVFGVEADIQGVWNDDNDNGFFGTGPSLFRVAPTAAGVTGTGFGVAPAVAGAGGNLALFEQGGAFGRNGLDWFGTLRLRAGVAFDRLLVYGTGGLAYGEGDSNNNFIITSSGNSIRAPFYISPAAAARGVSVNNGGGIFDNGDDIRWGWTLGAGVEYAFTNNLTLKLEGLWVNLDRDNNFVGTGTGNAGVTNTGAPVRRTDAGFSFNNDDSSDFFIVRGGLNWKFNTF